MNRAEVDAFLAECDDVITDWDGGTDSASWSADGSHEVVTGGDSYYDDHWHPERRPGLAQPRSVEGMRADQPLLRRRYPAPVEVQGRLWPRVTADAWPGRYHEHWAGLDHVELWRAVRHGFVEFRRPRLMPDTFLPDGPVHLDETHAFHFVSVLFAVRQFAAYGAAWPVLVDGEGRCIGPVWAHQILHVR